ncbi:hypothetical protein TRVL_07196 [Trypanosoma vivax]|nr:hypothetical protein TRVL_07196 [Trypanosoma vivax]
MSTQSLRPCWLRCPAYKYPRKVLVKMSLNALVCFSINFTINGALQSIVGCCSARLSWRLFERTGAASVQDAHKCHKLVSSQSACFLALCVEFKSNLCSCSSCCFSRHKAQSSSPCLSSALLLWRNPQICSVRIVPVICNLYGTSRIWCCDALCAMVHRLPAERERDGSAGAKRP